MRLGDGLALGEEALEPLPEGRRNLALASSRATPTHQRRRAVTLVRHAEPPQGVVGDLERQCEPAKVDLRVFGQAHHGDVSSVEITLRKRRYQGPGDENLHVSVAPDDASLSGEPPHAGRLWREGQGGHRSGDSHACSNARRAKIFPQIVRICRRR